MNDDNDGDNIIGLFDNKPKHSSISAEEVAEDQKLIQDDYTIVLVDGSELEVVGFLYMTGSSYCWFAEDQKVNLVVSHDQVKYITRNI